MCLVTIGLRLNELDTMTLVNSKVRNNHGDAQNKKTFREF